MGTYRIDVTDSTGKIESMDAYTKIVYGGGLNSTNYFDIIIENAGINDFAKFEKGFTIDIYRNGTLELKGIIDKRTIISGGFLRIQGLGYIDKKLIDANAPNKNTNNWTTLTTDSIVRTIAANAPSMTVQIVNDTTVASFRTANNETCFDAIARYCALSGQDFSADYSTGTILKIENHHGTTASLTTLNDGLDIDSIEKDEDDRKKIKKVTVWGKGPGIGATANQVVGSYSSGWSQGDNEVTLIEKDIDTNAEANRRALDEYTIMSATRFTYNFNVINVDLSFTLGDVITLYSDSTNTNTTVRITSFKRVVTKDNEKLSLEVRGTGERESAEDRVKQMAEQRKANDIANIFKQPSDQMAAALSGSAASHDHSSYTSTHTHTITALTSGAQSQRFVYVSTWSESGSFGVGNALVKIRAPSPAFDYAFVSAQVQTTGTSGSGTLAWRIRNQTGPTTILSYSEGVSGDVYAGANSDPDTSVDVVANGFHDFDITSLPPGATVKEVTITITTQRNHTHAVAAVSGGALIADAGVVATANSPSLSAGTAGAHTH